MATKQPMQLSKGLKQRSWLLFALVFLLLIIDQALKIWVKSTMILGESHYITSWFQIHFLENRGMAFGIELGNKLFLTLFRIVAMAFCSFILYRAAQTRRWPLGFLLCLALIIAGGVGNIIDSVFYGALFSSSHGQVAEFLPAGGGYASWFHGWVVDMFYFPLIHSQFPSWLPIWGGQNFTFFSPIFNFADACISVGVIVVFLFYARSINDLLEQISPLVKGQIDRDGSIVGKSDELTDSDNKGDSNENAS